MIKLAFLLQSKHGVEGEKLDYLTLRLQTVETENDRLKTESLRLKTENDKLRMVNFKTQRHIPHYPIYMSILFRSLYY